MTIPNFFTKSFQSFNAVWRADFSNNTKQDLQPLIYKSSSILASAASTLNIHFSNKKNLDYLSEKISEVLIEGDPNWHKYRIIINLTRNFFYYLKKVESRVVNDLKNDSGFRELFALKESDPISSIETARGESHNSGSTVCFIQIGDKKIVYKPRSVLPERLICCSKNSLFKESGLPNYKIWNKKDYGYQEYLEYDISKNEFNLNEFKKYINKIALIEALAKRVRLTDLHCDNVMLISKKPYLIDVEVILDPMQVGVFKTNLVDPPHSGSSHFKENSQNRYLLTQSTRNLFPSDVLLNLEQMLQINSLHHIGINFTELLKEKEKNLPLNVRKKIQSSKLELKYEFVRVLPYSTNLLRGLANSYLTNKTKKYFIETIIEKLGTIQLKLINEEKFISGLRKDFSNNDVPIFYYAPKDSEIYFHGVVIGTKQ